MPGLDFVRFGTDRLRVGPWRGDDRVAYVAPASDRPPPTERAVRHCLSVLAARGFHEVITGALSAGEVRGFLDAGFEVRERLYLLARPLHDLPAVPDAPLRRARRSDRPSVLEVDGHCFPGFWRLDDAGLTEALAATPSSRFRVAGPASRRLSGDPASRRLSGDPASRRLSGDPASRRLSGDPALRRLSGDVGSSVAGYAVSGRAGERGYLQRLAVDPVHQRQGFGAALVLDGLHWMRRRGCNQVVVNTQEGNGSALDLYERLGFRRQPGGLAVLEAAI